MSTRPRLTPAIADVRSAVRSALVPLMTPVAQMTRLAQWSAESQAARPGRREPGTSVRVLVALSGGPDSLALAAATAFEAKRLLNVTAGAVIIDHRIQEGSADVAARAAEQARALGLDPVLVRTVTVGIVGGPESAARDARYAALAEVARKSGASAVLLGHTRDDQAESVLLGLARGSGLGSIKGMARESGLYLRPLLSVGRETTVRFCADSGLEPWLDPQNDDVRFARVRVRKIVLPMLERELGPGFAEALARTADLAREDTDALDRFAADQLEELADHAEAGISLAARALEHDPPALRQRIIRATVLAEFGVSLSRSQTLEVSRLVTDWHGQSAVALPGISVERVGGLLHFRSTRTEPGR
ncbi:tRNA lysidine(34) synthetase TilS [Glaciihabitans sp. INWT7]|uniref:tRNA lysidine(34) synthetase TilS n=1 Tax=Glaciihabitans sp. INWT7 TaxID=2596912 RepID=UPI0016262999|nr:tRNA lysidine(34) synthetase TilS [Glaciihabitans sp. INWT7]QNE48038.1 tRNA lysidine(34) synthetase TilS [Glaciihabitans sp. INWT7]